MSIILLYNSAQGWIARGSSDVISWKENHRNMAFELGPRPWSTWH
jgi:hypothetical protein